MAGFAAHIPTSEWAALGTLRLVPDLEVLELGERLWLRGPRLATALDKALDKALEAALRCLPGVRRFTAAPDGSLVEVGHLLPSAPCPSGPWCALTDWLEFRPQTAALPGVVSARVALSLTRGSDAEEPALLLTTATAFALYVRTAPALRLARWRFALDHTGRALVLGQPLPPLPGQRFTVRDGVAIPCGLRLNQPFDSASLQSLLELLPGELAMLHEDGSREQLPSSAFVAASRSALAYSWQPSAEGGHV